MAKSFIQTYLENPNIRLFNLQDVLEHSKYVQDVVSYHTQDLDVNWLCVFENDGLLINPFKITLYRTEILNVLGSPREKDPHKITLEFSYTDRAIVELGKSWTADVEHTEPVKHRLTLNELDDILTDKTVQRLKALVFTELGKFYNCETIINQRNHSMCEENKDQSQEPFTYNPKDSTGEYYVHNHSFETINYMEYLAEEWTKNKLPPKVICDLLQVAKYLSPRLGRKGGKEELEKDLFKIENYAHRARTGGWINLEDSRENK